MKHIRPDVPHPPVAGKTPGQLPAGNGKLDRIALHTRGLVENLTEWVELRIRLVQIEVMEAVEDRLNKLVGGIMVLAAGILTLLFLLVTVALGLGALLGHAAWGFLIVTALLGIATYAIHRARPQVVRLGESETEIVQEQPADRLSTDKP